MNFLSPQSVKSPNYCFVKLIIVLAALILVAQGYKQELWLYSEEGPALYFDKPVADLRLYKSMMTSNQRFCSRGLWYSYTGPNFETFDRIISGNNVGTAGDIACGHQNAVKWDSVRFQGSNDTTVESISLYTGPVWSGQKIVISAANQSFSSPISVGSLGVTGKGNWTVFEGPKFDGKSMCYQGNQGTYYLGDFLSTSGFGPLKAVGSVAKGCSTDCFKDCIMPPN